MLMVRAIYESLHVSEVKKPDTRHETSHVKQNRIAVTTHQLGSKLVTSQPVKLGQAISYSGMMYLWPGFENLIRAYLLNVQCAFSVDKIPTNPLKAREDCMRLPFICSL